METHLLGSWSTDIWAEHDFVWRFAVHVLLVQFAVENLEVATSAVNVLFVLHRELDDKRLVFVGEGSEFVGESVEAGIL
jgi:hypothetical protein